MNIAVKLTVNYFFFNKWKHNLCCKNVLHLKSNSSMTFFFNSGIGFHMSLPEMFCFSVIRLEIKKKNLRLQKTFFRYYFPVCN